MNTTEALQGAVEMLQKIANGGSYNRVEYIERLMSYESALAQIQRIHIEDESKRATENADFLRRTFGCG